MKRPLIIATLVGIMIGVLLTGTVAAAGQMIHLVVKGQEVQNMPVDFR